MNDLPPVGFSVMGALALFIGASVYLGILAERKIQKSSFLQGYFLGNRGLGAWALALTATVQSGGTFMGFPSLVYAHGWSVALWICGYMVVPMSGFSVLGKRLAFLSRRTGAITVPELFRERFASPLVGLTSSLLIIFFMTTMMIAQFKAGAIVMKLAWPGSNTLALSEEFEEPQAESPAKGEQSSAGADDQSNEEKAAAAAPAGPAVAKKAKPKSSDQDYRYYTGLVIFTITVVGYTLVGGFLAGVWTDLFQSVMMLIGVSILLFLAIPAAGGLENATRAAVEVTGEEYARGPGHEFRPPRTDDERAVSRKVEVTRTVRGEAARAADGSTEPKTVTETIEVYRNPRQFLSTGLAVSFFFVWVFSGLGSPAGMVRVMASENTEVVRKSIFMLSAYNCMIYIPLICICIAGRAIIPSLDKPDEIVPRLALILTQDIPGGSLLTGLILAAPFGAVMATVSCYLLVIASGLVQDIYLRFLRPKAHEAEIKRVTYATMIFVGLLAIAANIYPVKFLQALVVFSGASGAATFVVPGLMAAYWRRGTANGALAAMISGAGTMCLLYFAGWLQKLAAPALTDSSAAGWKKTIAGILGPDPMIGLDNALSPYYLMGVDPILWGLGISAFAGVVVSLLTAPPPKEYVDRLFEDPQPATA